MNMLRVVVGLGVLFVSVFESRSASAVEGSATNFRVKSIDGETIDLASAYQGKVLLVVNVASKCGYTPQYKGLQGLYEKYKEQGLVVLGFPCNEFNGQEPGSEAEIKQFCSTKYNVSFPMFSKIKVNGPEADPLYKHLTSQVTKPQKSGKISWNFEKFLIGRDGTVVARFSPGTNPDAQELIQAIEQALK